MTLLLLVVLAQAHPLTVVSTRRTGSTASEALAVARQVAVLLDEAGVPVTLGAADAASKLAAMGTKDPGICQGKKACELELARQLEVKVLVTVSLAKLDPDLGVGLEALRTQDGAVLASESVLVAGNAVLSADRLAGFTAKLREALGLKAPAATPPPALVPRRDERPVVLPAPLPPSQPEPSHALGAVLVAGAALSAVAAVTFGIIGANANAQRVRLDGSDSAISFRDAQSWAQRTNTMLTAAAATGGAAVLLGTTAVIAW